MSFLRSVWAAFWNWRRHRDRSVERVSQLQSADGARAEICGHCGMSVNGAVFSGQLADGDQRYQHHTRNGAVSGHAVKDNKGSVGSIHHLFEYGLLSGNGLGFVGHDGLLRYQVAQDGGWLILTENEYHARRRAALAGEARS